MIRLLQIRHSWLMPLVSWLIVTGISLVWNLARLVQVSRDIAREQGRIMYKMVRQSKINPVLMVNDPDFFRQHSFKDISYRIVSTSPVNQENRADDWEARALGRFKRDTDSAFEKSEQGETPCFATSVPSSCSRSVCSAMAARG